MVDSNEGVVGLLSTLAKNIDLASSNSRDPALAIDIDGQNLGRDGTISLIQILIIEKHQVFLIDVATLGAAAFSNTAATAQSTLTLKSFFEANNVPKLLWDCRGDNDALYSLYGITMDCVFDVQLMDLATREELGERKTIKSFKHAAPQRLHKELSQETHHSCTSVKEFGSLAFEKG